MSNSAKQIIKKQPQIAIQRKKSYNVVISAIFCFLFAFILYSNTLNHSYVLDDNDIIINNWVVKKGVLNNSVVISKR